MYHYTLNLHASVEILVVCDAMFVLPTSVAGPVMVCLDYVHQWLVL